MMFTIATTLESRGEELIPEIGRTPVTYLREASPTVSGLYTALRCSWSKNEKQYSGLVYEHKDGRISVVDGHGSCDGGTVVIDL